MIGRCSHVLCRASFMIIVPFAFAWLAGCGTRATLPSEVDITLPDNTKVGSRQGVGPQSLANTEWSFYRATDNALLTRVRFNADGGVAELYDNFALAPSVFGQTVTADGKSHATSTQGLTYTAASYGAENESGFSFQLRALAYFNGLEVGNGSAFASGTHDGQRMEGTFGFKSQVTGLAANFVPEEANASEEFEFFATIIEADEVDDGGKD